MNNVDKNKMLEAPGLIATKCPNCAGILTLKKAGQVECIYCGSKFFLHEAYRGADEKVHNYFELAYNAEAGSNPDEAYEYFTKILEIDRREALAWYGKGIAALGKTTGLAINTQEAIVCFDKALDYTELEDKDKLKKAIADSARYYGNAIYNWYIRYGWLDVRNSEEICNLYFYSDKQFPWGVPGLKKLVVILDGVPINYTAKIAEYAGRIRQTEPKYKTPLQQRQHAQMIKTIIILIVVISIVLFCVYLCKK